MARLRRVDASDPGITRRGRGRGFEYFGPDGERITDGEEIARIRSLAIPPAWRDVWICPDPTGHIQATGLDAAGRKQYRYHDRWRERRDQQKFDSMVDFARALPDMRERVERDLRREQLDRPRVLACAVRLLELGFFRIGGEEYAVDNESFGLATMLKRHVSVDGNRVTFDYPAKSGQRRVQSIVDEDAVEVVETLKRRRHGRELLAYKERGRWRDIRSEDVNAYVKEVTGGDFTAKDFRTWNATVLAAVALAVSAPAARTSKRATERAIRRAVQEVARYLGNTPTVARSSYIDPRVFDRYRDGLTIGGVLPHVGEDGDLGAVHGSIEEAVLDLIAGEESHPIQRVA